MNSTNTTAISINDEVAGVIFFFTGCAVMLVSLIVILFAKMDKDSTCFHIFKYIKIKLLKYCCCCCGKKKTNEMVEKNAQQLKDLILEQ